MSLNAETITLFDLDGEAIAMLTPTGLAFSPNGEFESRRLEIGLSKSGEGQVLLRDKRGRTRLSIAGAQDGEAFTILFENENGDGEVVLGNTEKGQGLFIVGKEGPRASLAANDERSTVVLRAKKGSGMTVVHATDTTAGTRSQVGDARAIQMLAAEDKTEMTLLRGTEKTVISP